MISVLASAPSLAERAIGVAEHLSVLVWMPLNMISVLPVTPKPCRKHNWGYWEREDSKQPVCRTNEAQGSLREETRWRRLW